MFNRLLLALIVVLALSAWAGADEPNFVEKTDAQKVRDLPDSVLTLRQMASKAYYEKKYGEFVLAMEKLHQLRPYNSEYMFQLALAYGLADKKTPAYNMMLIMQRQGLSYDFDQTPDSATLRGTALYKYLNDLMVKAGEPWGEAESAFNLPGDVLLAEALEWDPVNQVFLVGSVVDGRIMRVSRDGKVTTLVKPDAENGLWGVFDIKVDAKRGEFWVSSAAVQQYNGFKKQDAGQSGLFLFDLNSGQFKKRYLASSREPHSLANLALATDGTVYAADSIKPVILRLAAGADEVEPYFVSPYFVSIRGIALADNDQKLYIADHERGVVMVNLQDKEATPLALLDNLNLGGIDGLYVWGKHLVLIQNGILPQRVIRLELADDGAQVANVRPLQVAHPEFDLPNFGAVVGDELYFFANSHWPVIGARGNVIPGQTAKPVQVLRLALDSGQDLVNPEIEQLREKLIRQRQGIATDSDSGDAEEDQNSADQKSG